MKRSPLFDADREKRAKQAGKHRAKTLEFWYRQKYGLTSQDPRYLAVTIEEIETEYWACHYLANPDKDEVEDTDFDLEAELQRIEENPDDWEVII